jgi:raffinose/stachyose/melibiose transport system substrate-binding protein
MPQATNFNSSPAVGGPSAAFQYAISSPRANNTMNADKLEAVLDWLMWITTPENNAAVVNDLGSFVPTIVGAKPLPANADLVSMLQAEPKVIDVGPLSLGPEAQQSYYREFQAYIQGNQTLDEAGRKVMQVFNRAADETISKAGFNAAPFLRR